MKFSFIPIPDTQITIQSWPDDWFAMMNWINANKDVLNIRGVIHEGDITEYPRNADKQRARDGFRSLQVPWCFCFGNHDYCDWNGSRDVTGSTSLACWAPYLPYSEESAKPTFVASYPAGTVNNTAHEFKVTEDLKFLVVSLGYVPSADELKWAADLIRVKPDHKVIINTHDYLLADGSRSSAGSNIWSTVASKFTNVVMVVCGHIPGAARRVDVGDGGNRVHQILADYQDYNNREPNSYLRIMQFDTEAKTCSVKTFSPAYNRYRSDAANQFVLTGLDWLGTTSPTPSPIPGGAVASIRIAFIDNSTMDSVANKLKTWAERKLAAAGMTDAEVAQLYITSANRGSSNIDYHTDTGVNGALDIAAPMTDAGQRLMQKVSRILIQDAPLLLEMIHSTPYSDDNGFYIKNGQPVTGAFYGEPNYGANGHINHIHLATNETMGSTLANKYPGSTTTPTPAPTPTPPPATTVGIPVGSKGVDYAFSRPSIPLLAQAGVKFAFRYLSFENSLTKPKILTNSEALALSQAGIAVVSNYEWYESRCTEGFAAGAADAKTAVSQARAAGAPDGKPIYFSVDTDTSPDSVRTYFQGIASVIPLSQIGVYGSYRVVKGLKEAGLVTWLWQTYAWSGGMWYSGNHVEQYQNGVTLANGTLDLNRNKVTDFGQWFHISVGGNTQTPTPALGDDDMPMINRELPPGGSITIRTPWGVAGASKWLVSAATDQAAPIGVKVRVVAHTDKGLQPPVEKTIGATTGDPAVDFGTYTNMDWVNITRADSTTAPVGILCFGS